MDAIYGGTIATDGVIKLTIDRDKIGYVKLPDYSFLTTTAGVISYTYPGAGGSVIFYVPKNSSEVNLGGLVPIYLEGILITDYSGVLLGNNLSTITGLSAINATTVNFQVCGLLTSALAFNATAVYFNGCALTAKSIGDNLLEFVANNPTAAGTANFSGGLNATVSFIDAYLITKGTTLSAVLSSLTTWTITLNED